MPGIKSPRIKSLDLARGFVVFLIAPVHSMLMFSNQTVWDSLPGKLFAFIAEWHGAQVFMLLMGISITFTNPKPLHVTFKRSGILLLIAYGLNILKFDIPYFFHFLPGGLLNELNIDPADHPLLHLLLIGDILHFAAIAYFLCSLLYCHKDYAWVAICSAIAVCFLSSFFFDATSNNALINEMLQLFTGQPPVVFFPVLPWIIYPFLGLWIGSELKKEKPAFGFDSFWLSGVSLLGAAGIIKYFLHDHVISSFYRTGPLDTILHVGVLFVFLSIWHWLSGNVKHNACFQLFSYCSRHITQIYILQWVLIFWALPVFGFRDLGFLSTGIAMIIITGLTLSISLLVRLAKKNRLNKIYGKDI
jgi:Heparan-alpha-glucosaminide N-acetyltransferase, catalytic